MVVNRDSVDAQDLNFPTTLKQRRSDFWHFPHQKCGILGSSYFALITHAVPKIILFILRGQLDQREKGRRNAQVYCNLGQNML